MNEAGLNIISRRLNVLTLLTAGLIFIVLFGFLSLRRPLADAVRIEDGTYRGSFMDRGIVQLNVHFTISEGKVTGASFRHLKFDDNFYLGTREEPYRSVVGQYEEALEYLVGKDIKKHLADLYSPGDIVSTTEVDGFTAATIRSGKIRSAIQDGLNRGVYAY